MRPYLKLKRFCLLRLSRDEQGAEALEKMVHFVTGNVGKFGFTLLSEYPTVIEQGIYQGNLADWGQSMAPIESALAKYSRLLLLSLVCELCLVVSFIVLWQVSLKISAQTE
jgi:hypothetical protein